MKSPLVFSLLIVFLSSVQACSTKPPSVSAATGVSESDKQYHATRDASTSSPPDLNAWLRAHPRIGNAITWQRRTASRSDPYAPPAASSKIVWRKWSERQKDDLIRAYLGTCAWLAQGAPQVSADPAGLTDQPLNIHPFQQNDHAPAREWVSASYMWKLYVIHVAFSLALELTNQLPWSILDYDDKSLRYLFDSATMAWNAGTHFSFGTSEGRVPKKRRDNLPRTSFGPPMWTYPFLLQAHLIGSSRSETIGMVLDWMRFNLSHFHGNNSFGTYNAVWQYRGYPPLSKIINGTIDANYPQLGRRKWTAGCHGSVGFLCAVLRVVNIPVQPVWICEHELPYFITEKLYLDHADTPYNDNVKNSEAPILSIVIDETTYKEWFSMDVSINVTDNASPVCSNVGRRIMDFIR